MLNRRFTVLFAVVGLAGCASNVSEETADEGTTESSEADLSGKRKHHYEPSVQGVVWRAGCGAVRPGHPPCETGLFMTFTKNYIDLEVTHSEKVDNVRRTLDITLDTWSYNTVHPLVAVRPQTIELSPRDLQLSQQYKVSVRDRKGAVLWTGNIATFLAL